MTYLSALFDVSEIATGDDIMEQQATLRPHKVKDYNRLLVFTCFTGSTAVADSEILFKIGDNILSRNFNTSATALAGSDHFKPVGDIIPADRELVIEHVSETADAYIEFQTLFMRRQTNQYTRRRRY